VEDVVREYVPSLKKSGPLWVACCPFHEEKTPSFKVDPRRGTWHCFGACSTGGDQLEFVQRFTGVGFLEAAEILAARTGVELPRKRGPKRDRDEHAGELEALERATRYFEKTLRSDEGRETREYLARRGLSEETVRAFRLGHAPAQGRALVSDARKAGVAFEVLERAGLARRNDRGHAYDFFRGRLTIPIRDLEGRVVGFGARCLRDEPGVPKYINSAETPLFQKGRLIYGLDRAIPEARRSGRLLLVEGYTDVMAAHQAGMTNVVAVLGTATTEDHTRLIRRAGARKVGLLFDGDAAGRKAAFKALHGLLPLEIELQVVTLPAGVDPCELLESGGREELERLVEEAPGWFDFAAAGLEGLRGAALSQELGEVLQLLPRLPKPVLRDAMLLELARRTGIADGTLREELARGRAPRRALERRDRGRPEPAAEPESEPRRDAITELSRRAYEGLARAVLLDESLVPVVRPHVEACPDPDLQRILEVVVQLYEADEEAISPSLVLTHLGDHPARRLVSGLAQSAEGLESPQALLEAELEFLNRRQREQRKRELTRRILELQDAIDQASLVPEREGGGAEELEAARDELERLRQEHAQLMEAARLPNGSALESHPQSATSHSAQAE
jgi:DNA primase